MSFRWAAAFIACAAAIAVAAPRIAYAQSAPPTVSLAMGDDIGTADAATPSADDSVNEDATALAKKLQNPIGNLYSIPFQSNTNFHYGPANGTQELLNIQPVIPLHITPDWNIITRTILPVIWQPSLQPAQTVPAGLGPTTFSAFVSPSQPVHGWVWGVGPVVQLPTITSKTLGSNVWGAGPTAALVYMKGPWVAGVLTNNVWSLGGTPPRRGTSYNAFLLQPFANYNFGGGWYVGSSPILTANWQVAGDKAWTVPVGANIGRVIKIGGKLPVNFSAGAYYNVDRTEGGATWQIRTQATIIF